MDFSKLGKRINFTKGYDIELKNYKGYSSLFGTNNRMKAQMFYTVMPENFVFTEKDEDNINIYFFIKDNKLVDFLKSFIKAKDVLFQGQ